MNREITKDIALNEDGDLLIKNGDFTVEPSDETHIKHILLSGKGCWREHPLCGVNIAKWLNAPLTPFDVTNLERKIRAQLNFDGFNVINLNVNDINNLQIQTKRVK